MSEQISVSNTNNTNYPNNNQITYSNSTQKDYTEYENLLPFPSNMDYIEFSKTTINTFKKLHTIREINENRQLQLDMLLAIENLRTARKYQHKIFENIMNCISERFSEKLKFLNNKRVVLNAMVLLSEIFSEYEIKSQKRWTMDLLNLTLKNKFDYLTEEIRDLADKNLKNFCKSFVYPETFEVLTQVILYSTDEEAEVCESLFKEVIANANPTALSRFDLNYMLDLFTDIPVSIDNLRIEILHRCFLYLKQKLSEEQFYSLVNLFEGENRNLFLEILNIKDKNC